MPSAKVWDLPTRVFHWSLAVLVILNFFTGEDEGLLLLVHAYCGYLVGLLLLFRLAWGVIGTRHARFADFVKPWSETRAYVAQLLRLRPPRYIGHNPLGGYMILAMLGTLALIVLTGMMAVRGEGATIPLFGWTPHWLAEAAEEIHEVAGNLMMVLAAVHVGGVLVDALLTRENLIASMITGRKDTAGAAVEPGSGGGWRAAALAAVLAFFGGYMMQGSDFSAVEQEDREVREDHERDDD